MSVNQATLVEMYVDKKMGIPDITKETGIPKSRIRSILLKQGVKLRTTKEALALVKYKIGSGRRGKTYIATDEARRNISIARKKYSALHAKGYDIHNGYVRISVGKNCGRLQHVVIMEQHIGRKLSKDEVVHHINGVKTDNRIENLKLMTNAEHSSLHAKLNVLRGNNYDISKHSKSGEDHHMAKLTWKDVDYIRASNKSTKELMKMFNMSKSAIEKVKSHKSWRINNVN